MQKRSRMPADPNRLAHAIGESIVRADAERDKNPAAVALGRLGGLKGGVARAASLSKKRRSEIAKRAAVVRWKAPRKD